MAVSKTENLTNLHRLFCYFCIEQFCSCCLWHLAYASGIWHMLMAFRKGISCFAQLRSMSKLWKLDLLMS